MFYILQHSPPFHQTQRSEVVKQNTNTFCQVILRDGMLLFGMF
jgi:hypothetical protein